MEADVRRNGVETIVWTLTDQQLYYKASDKHLAESDVGVADLLGQMFTVDAVEAMCRVDAVHVTHSTDTA